VTGVVLQGAANGVKPPLSGSETTLDPGLPSLTVAFSTRGARALDLDPASWPAAPGLDYLVLVQEAEADVRVLSHLAAAGRCDVTVAALATTGLAKSRNAALERAAGEVVLLADDDVAHLPGAFAAVRRFFATHPEATLLVGRSLDAEGALRRRGWSRPRRLSRWNSGRAASHEMAFRRAPVLAAGIRFDEAFGVGAGTPDFLGEEYIFIADCLAAGLVGWHAPLRVTVHPGESTGGRWEGPEAMRARAAVIARVFGRAAPLARLGYAARHRRRFAGARDLWRFLRG
jgi:hypothetical protein